MELLGFSEPEQLQQARAQWVDGVLERGLPGRNGSCTESLAVGSEPTWIRPRFVIRC